MKSIFLTSALLLLLSACSDSIHSTIQDVKAKNQTSAIIKSQVIGASSEAPQDIILSGGKENFYAVLDKDYKLQIGDRVKLSCNQLRVKTFGKELLSNLVYGIQAAFSVDCSSSCLPFLKMTLLTTKVNKLNP